MARWLILAAFFLSIGLMFAAIGQPMRDPEGILVLASLCLLGVPGCLLAAVVVRQQSIADSRSRIGDH
jgi:hypothetical protein